jgi:Mg2+ and Co2+ transporter CorA
MWEALKYNNSRMLELGRFVEAVSKSQISMLERIVDLEKGLSTLSNSVSKLVDVLTGNQTDKTPISKQANGNDADGLEYVR